MVEQLNDRLVNARLIEVARLIRVKIHPQASGEQGQKANSA